MSGVTVLTRHLADVLDERDRQDAKWGPQNHDPFAWLVILMEEVGEASKAALEARVQGDRNAEAYDFTAYRTEIVQTCAVALAMIEALDRGTWCWGDLNVTEAPR